VIELKGLIKCNHQKWKSSARSVSDSSWPLCVGFLPPEPMGNEGLRSIIRQGRSENFFIASFYTEKEGNVRVIVLSFTTDFWEERF
jgi:hypothetical protein